MHHICYIYILYCIVTICGGQLYVDTYLCIVHHICCVLDAFYIIHLYIILYYVYLANVIPIFFAIFLYIFPTFPQLQLKSIKNADQTGFETSVKTTTIKPKNG
jgi:hypothetical protein